MDLNTVFMAGFKHAEDLTKLYEGLQSTNTRAARADWVNNVYGSKIVRWARRDGLWRSTGADILVIGNKNAILSPKSFGGDNLAILLRSALVFAMAAVDKVLHDAITKKFVALVKAGDLDDIVRLPISESYAVAIKSRVRRGKGGKKKVRPSHLLKDVALDRLYRNSFLSNRQMQDICRACGLPKVFQAFASQNGFQPRTVSIRWARLYQKRNHLAHECDIVRKEKAKKVHLHALDPQTMIAEIDFVKKIGIFIATRLN